MKKNLWLFLLKVALLTLVFGWLWFSRLQRAYPDLIGPIAEPFFELVGVRKWWLALVAEHFTNIVPYMALVLAAPGLIKDWKRTLVAFFGGLAILVLVHLLMSTAVYYVVASYEMSKTAYKILLPIYLVNDALPLVLWLAFFPKVFSELFSFVRFGGEEAPGKA